MKKPTKAEPATEPATMDESNDLALIDAVTRVGQALTMRFGVMKPTITDAEQLAAAALTYARALVVKARS